MFFLLSVAQKINNLRISVTDEMELRRILGTPMFVELLGEDKRYLFYLQDDDIYILILQRNEVGIYVYVEYRKIKYTSSFLR